MSNLCLTCAYMRRDDHSFHIRCFSPQLVKMRLGGILVNFERDATPEDGRSHAEGTGKCGTQHLNYKRREDV